MLAGQISSSCIPLVDMRDVAGNLVHGNFLMAGISAVGLIPYGGDIAKAGSKLSGFVLKNLDNVPEIAKASRFLLENCPDLVKGLSKSDEFVAAMKKLGESDLGRLTKAEREALEEFYEKIGLKGVLKRGADVMSGGWKAVKESMSDFSRAYQKQITGQEGLAWVQNGVKFDGIKDGVLLDAKGKYSQFIDKSTGEFYEWFSGKQSFIDEAIRQINASDGAKIQWYFAEEEALNAVRDLFMDQGITGIELFFEALR